MTVATLGEEHDLRSIYLGESAMSVLVGAQSLTQTEQRLRQRIKELCTISVLGQLPLDEEDIRILGEVIKDDIDYSTSEASGLSEKGPLSLSCFLVWMGIEYYDQGTYWAKVQKHLGKEGRVWQRRWGKIFLDTIERYRLTVFNSEGHKYVTPILLHGGIPDRCLPDFFRNVLYPIVNGAMDVDAGNPEELLVEWRSKSSLYQTTDIPVRRFLEEGGKPAADFLDRCIEMARMVYYGDQIPPAAELGLPERVVENFRQWWSSGSRPFATAGRVALRRPLLELDTSYGGVRCSLPEQTILNESESPVLIQVKADEKIAFACEAPSYVRASGVITEPIDCALPPARSYEVTLQQHPELSRKWSFDGLGDNDWIAFDSNQSLIRESELPRGVFWLAFDRRSSLDVKAHVREAIDGTDGWEAYRFSLVDTSDAESLEIVRESGKRVPLPLAKGKAPEICGELVADCNVKGLPVYTGRLPIIQVPLPHPDEIDGWDLVVEDLTADVPLRRYAALRDVVVDIKGDKGIVLLSHASLLGHPLLGEYRVKLRSRGALGRNKQFQFAFVRDLRYEFDLPLYLSSERPKLTLTATSCKVFLGEESSEVTGHNGSYDIVAKAESNLLNLSLEGNAGRTLPLTFNVPRLRWAIRGMADTVSLAWLSEPVDVDLMDFERGDEVFLIAQLPFENGTPAIVELEGTSQRKEARILNQQLRISLSQFLDSLRNLNRPIGSFYFSVIHPRYGEKKICALRVRIRWVVTEFEFQNTRRSVSFSWTGDTKHITENIHSVLFRWKDPGRFRNRKLRLWNLLCLRESAKEYRVPDGVSELEISENTSMIGRYRVELLLENEFEREFKRDSPTFPPRRNDTDVFDISIGSPNKAYGLSSSPLTFRQYLDSKIVGCDQAVRLTDFVLTEDDVEALAYVLIFLTRDRKTSEVKQLWFKGLRANIRRPRVRTLLRERIKMFAESEDQGLKTDLLVLSKTIGLSATSLIPVELDSKVRLKGKIALFKGISEWDGSKPLSYREDPCDLIWLEYSHSRQRLVSLSFLDEVKQTPQDAALS